MSWPGPRFHYDDESCPKRQLGLNHVLKEGACAECGVSLWPRDMRMEAASASVAPGPAPSKDRCNFWTCDVKVTICSYIKLWRTLPDGSSMLEDEKVDTWFCFDHTDAVRSAPKRQLKVRRSVEGWVWIDTLDHIRFAT